jgi:farnesyl diphosphate synthase
MVGGQMLDLIAENSTFELGEITRLQRLKTGEMIAYGATAGAVLGKVPHRLYTALHSYAHDLGLAFQITDDLLDQEGESARTGKATGQDAAAGKETFVSILGPERAREQARLLVQQAKDHLGPFDGDDETGRRAGLLKAVADYVIERQG